MHSSESDKQSYHFSDKKETQVILSFFFHLSLGHGKIVAGNSHVWVGTGTGVAELTNRSLDEIISNIYTGGHFSNPNLLDNWYFGDPINQKGESIYTHPSWGLGVIDRWRISNMTLSISPYGHISLQNLDTAPDKYCEIDQSVDTSTWSYMHAGQSITMSMIYRSSSNLRFYARFETVGEDPVRYLEFDDCTAPMSNAWNLVSYTFTIPSEYFHILNVMIGMGQGISADIKAIKLEFGSHQTLAHKEGAVLVLNDYPNKAVELEKCQRYQLVIPNSVSGAHDPIGNGYSWSPTGLAIRVFVPTTMRKKSNRSRYWKI